MPGSLRIASNVILDPHIQKKDENIFFQDCQGGTRNFPPSFFLLGWKVTLLLERLQEVINLKQTPYLLKLNTWTKARENSYAHIPSHHDMMLKDS